MLNYQVDPAILAPFVPSGTELDSWQGRHYVSVVAFRFLRTRVLGVPIPFHRDFDEINLRFYVGREGPDGWRRGVVFIKEVVPRRIIAAVARWVYNENYVACPTASAIRHPDENGQGSLKYTWRPRGLGELGVDARIVGAPQPLEPGSEAEFIAEHYWGYSRQRDGSTVEYRVEHPRWLVRQGHEPKLSGPVSEFYGRDFGSALSGPPLSSFVASGSEVAVHRGRRLHLEDSP